MKAGSATDKHYFQVEHSTTWEWIGFSSPQQPLCVQKLTRAPFQIKMKAEPFIGVSGLRLPTIKTQNVEETS